MSTALRHLGSIIKAFRRQRGVTQAELAQVTVPPTNRSLIAHFEQGRRIPSADLLRQICTFLGVPEKIWSPFLAPGFQRFRTARAAGKWRLRPFQIIAIAGPSGSGKTTLATNLARALNVPCLPKGVHPKKYLSDLKLDPTRWAFETQLAFLTNKATEVLKRIENGQSIVLDRTISEDVQIYAKHFQHHGHIDERSSDTYLSLSEHFLRLLPPPDLVIYSQISREESVRRIRERNRADLGFHTDDYLSSIFSLYQEWLKKYTGSPLYSINGEEVDYRNPIIIEQICYDIEQILRPVTANGLQLSLFLDDEQKRPTSYRSISHLSPVRPFSRNSQMETNHSRTISPGQFAPVAYIAAPFSGVAQDAERGDHADLFPQKSPHGVIPRGKYRALLFRVERVLKDAGLLTILPHRDVNEWGRRTLTPRKAMKLCTQHVEACDIFIGILGMSSGAHYEYGLARGLGKPCIILLLDDLPSSFLANGVSVLDDEALLTLSVKSSLDISSALTGPKMKNFLERNLLTTDLCQK